MKSETTYHVTVANIDGDFKLSPTSGHMYGDYGKAIAEWNRLSEYYEMDQLMVYKYNSEEGYQILLDGNRKSVSE